MVYLDKEIKFSNNFEKIRSLFEKCLTVDFKIKTLKTIIKKYLEFEKDNGNAKTLEHVKNLTQQIIVNKLGQLKREEDNNNDNMDIDG